MAFVQICWNCSELRTLTVSCLTKLGIADEIGPAQALADWCAFAEFGAADHWPRRWAEAYTGRCHDEVYLWLKANGIGFFPVPHWVERGPMAMPCSPLHRRSPRCRAATATHWAS